MANTSTFKKLLNFFWQGRDKASGMHTDMHPSQQPEGTYRNAYGVSNQSTEEKGGGVYNMAGTIIHGEPPAGTVVRGEHLLEETDRQVLFLTHGGGKSEIGYINLNTRQYTKVLSDDDIEGCSLEFGLHEWIPIISKAMRNGTCIEIHLYWTNGSYYKTINLDRPIIPIKCEDIFLLKCHAAPTPKAFASNTGGRNLEGGINQYVCQFEDNDGNTTNWFQICGPVSIETENNIAGEISKQSVHVVLTNLSPHYHKVNIAVIKTIAGHPSAWLIAKEYYTTNSLEFIHRSTAQQIYQLDLEEILTKKNGYFRGFDIFQFDGQMFPHNLLGERNENWQKMVDEIEIFYRIVGYPLEYAHLGSGLRADEVYGIGIAGNYCDGTRTRVFHKKGRKATGSDLTEVAPGDANCLDCTVPRWKVENTAERTELICDDPGQIGPQDEDIEYDTGNPIYTENPKPTDPLTDDDAAGVPNEDDIKGSGDGYQRQMECICKNLKKVFAIYDFYNSLAFIQLPITTKVMHQHLMSDPVSIATMKCVCEELANQGGANDDDNDDDPVVTCDCCDQCNDGEIDESCDCCRDCNQ